MNKFLFLLFFISISVFSQQEKDSVITVKMDSLFAAKDTIRKNSKTELFSDSDLKTIDSLLVYQKFNSPLIDTLVYVIADKDIIGSSETVLTTPLLKLRLSDLDKKTPFNLAFNPALEKVINSYLRHRKKYYPALMAKAKYYFPMFEQYLDQYDIPLEMKYLAIVESALNPTAKSGVGATGLWQFMYPTGVQYKLKVSSYVDERQDPVRATIAACAYLSDLYTIFGDWDLALAAYNSGPGNVAKAIKRSGGYRNYWNIRPFLPKETASYVPAFYATMYLFEYQTAHDLVPEAPQIRFFETDTIQIKQTVSFDQVSEKTAISSALIQFLNPSYKLGIIPFVAGKDYTIRLPRKNSFTFIENEMAIYELAREDAAKREKPLPKYFEMDKRIRYTVRNGDFLGKIANKFGVRVRDIKRWNRMKTTRLKIGQRLSIYPRKF